MPGSRKVAECCSLDVGDHAAVAGFCKENAIGLVVIGPEAPVVAGLADDLERRHPLFGPTKAAAQLEGSKGFTKDLCARAASRPPPTPGSTMRPRPWLTWRRRAPIVIKADGLAPARA